MTHAFLLMLYLGKQVVSKDMYFASIDRCKYFAERLNNQPAVPNANAGDGDPKMVRYTAVCVPKVVNQKNKIMY